MPTILYFVRKWLTRLGNLLSESTLSVDDIQQLVSSRRHSPYLARHRASVINARIRAVCWLFALLVLAWLPVDVLLLPEALMLKLVYLRLATAAVFFALALSINTDNLWAHMPLRMAIMVFTPMLFYVLVLFFSAGVELHGLAAILLGIYNLLPFLVIVGLAIFPLTIIEGLVFGMPVLVVMVLGATFGHHFSSSFYVPAAWMLVLILGVDVISAAIQLNYMSSLLSRISKDGLTGAYTRHTGQELLEIHFQLAIEEERPFAIAFVDLDHFKLINDEYGHDAGDKALKSAVAHIKRKLRKGDHVVRWGGEEFLLILQDANIEGIELILSRLQGDWLGVRPDGTPLTASIGLSERIADGVNDWLSLVEIADQRMYRAKMAGRACAVYRD